MTSPLLLWTDNSGQTLCNSGHGTEVTVVSQNKWLLNWVEIFEKLQTPFDGALRYILPDAPSIVSPLYFSKPKFYLPDDAYPVFTLTIYKGQTNIRMQEEFVKHTLLSLTSCLLGVFKQFNSFFILYVTLSTWVTIYVLKMELNIRLGQFVSKIWNWKIYSSW